jgi:hypothetical protein
MNLFASAGNFGVGLTNATYWASDKKLTEFKAAADTTTGVWGGKLAIDVTSVSLSSAALRATTDITVAFKLPATTDTVTAASDFVAVQLPYQWMGVSGWMDGSATATAALKLVTTTGTGAAAKTTKTAVKGAVSQVSGCNVVFALDTTATKLAEGSSYEFTLSSVPTAENAVFGAQMNLGSLVMSVGKVATGGFGYSSAQLFNALASQAAPKGKALLEFSSTSLLSLEVLTPRMPSASNQLLVTSLLMFLFLSKEPLSRPTQLSFLLRWVLLRFVVIWVLPPRPKCLLIASDGLSTTVLTSTLTSQLSWPLSTVLLLLLTSQTRLLALSMDLLSQLLSPLLLFHSLTSPSLSPLPLLLMRKRLITLLVLLQMPVNLSLLRLVPLKVSSDSSVVLRKP